MLRPVLNSLLIALCAAGAANAAVVDRPFSLTPEAAAQALVAAAPVNAAENAFQGGETLALRGMYASDSISAQEKTLSAFAAEHAIRRRQLSASARALAACADQEPFHGAPQPLSLRDVVTGGADAVV